MQNHDGPNLTSAMLHLGCGLKAPKDWLNVDGSLQVVFARHPRLKDLLSTLKVYPRSQAEIVWPTNILRCDLRKPLPFADHKFIAVYSSHTLEHLFYNQAVDLLRECYRVLKSEGICRMVVPDLAAIIQKYLFTSQSDKAASAADEMMTELLVHPRTVEKGLLGLYQRTMGFHQHKWMYDASSLNKLFGDAGFIEVSNPACQRGRLPGLQEVEDPSRVLDGAGIIVEGVKP